MEADRVNHNSDDRAATRGDWIRPGMAVQHWMGLLPKWGTGTRSHRSGRSAAHGQSLTDGYFDWFLSKFPRYWPGSGAVKAPTRSTEKPVAVHLERG